MGTANAPNIILLVLDCVRAKNVGPMGAGPIARTPILDELGRRGSVFPHAVSPGNWTVPSHMSMFTGVYPSVHGVRTFSQGSAPVETVASWLGRRGYRTALFSETVHVVGGYGLEDGYQDRFAPEFGVSDEERTLSNMAAPHLRILYSHWTRDVIQRLPPLIFGLNALNHPQEVAFKKRVVGEYLLRDFAGWLDRGPRSTPFHAFVNFSDAHEPYDLVPDGHPEGLMARWYAKTPRYYLLSIDGLQDHVPWPGLERGYIHSIEAADRKVGKLLEILEQRGLRENTLIIVTADHGQSFGERGNVYHGCGATESILRVPLIVSGPAEWSLPPVVPDWVSLIQVSPWMKASAAGRAPFDEAGRAPVPFGSPTDRPVPVYGEGSPASDPNRSLAGVNHDRRWNHRLLAAYQSSAKTLLDLDTGEVFDWEFPSDPDTAPPRAYSALEGERVRERVFGPYERLEKAHSSDSQRASRIPVKLNAQLVSWGYD